MTEQPPPPSRRRRRSAVPDTVYDVAGNDRRNHSAADGVQFVNGPKQQHQREYAIILEPHRHSQRQLPTSTKDMVRELNGQLRRQPEINRTSKTNNEYRNFGKPNYVTPSTNTNPTAFPQQRNCRAPPQIPSRAPLHTSSRSSSGRQVADQRPVSTTATRVHYHTPRTSSSAQQQQVPADSAHRAVSQSSRVLLPPTPVALAAIQLRSSMKKRNQLTESIPMPSDGPAERPPYFHLKEFISSSIAAPPATPPRVAGLTPRNSVTTTTSSNGYSSYSPSSESPMLLPPFPSLKQHSKLTSRNDDNRGSVRARARKPTAIITPPTAQTSVTTFKCYPTDANQNEFCDKNDSGYDRFNALNISTRKLRHPAKPSSFPSSASHRELSLNGQHLTNGRTQYDDDHRVDPPLPSPPPVPPKTYHYSSTENSNNNFRKDTEQREKLVQIVSAQNKALDEQNEALQKTDADIRRVERKTRRMNVGINRLCSLDQNSDILVAARDASAIGTACCESCNRDLKAQIRRLHLKMPHEQQVSTATLMTEWTPCQSCLSAVLDVFGQILSTNWALIDSETKYNALLFNAVEKQQQPLSAVVSVVVNGTY